MIVPTAEVDNLKYFLFRLYDIKASRHKKGKKKCFLNFFPMKYNGWKELTRTSVVTLSLLHPFDSRTCQCRSVYLKCSSPRESGRRDCQDMCNIVKQQNNSCSVLRDADAYFGI